jgi:hypothetical protein
LARNHEKKEESIMARFRLTAPHYIRLAEPTYWEAKEQDNTTNRMVRKQYEVPSYLNSEDLSSCNYPGEIIVSTKKDPAYPRDFVFLGPPTRDMEPLDDEAKKMLAKLDYDHPIEGLPANFDADTVPVKAARRI